MTFQINLFYFTRIFYFIQLFYTEYLFQNNGFELLFINMLME